MKRPFLVVDNYGMGGLWAYVWAESEEDIRRKLDVEIVRELPEWLREHERGVTSVDIDQAPDLDASAVEALRTGRAGPPPNRFAVAGGWSVPEKELDPRDRGV